jgi:MFS family permease
MQTSQPHRAGLRTHAGLALLALVYIFSYIDRQAIAVLIEPLKHEFRVSDTAIGLVSGFAFAVFYAGLGVPIGRLADRGNRRNIVALCCGLWSLATMACGLCMQFWQLVLARMGVAVGEAGGMAPSVSLIADLYPPQRRSLILSIYMLGPNLGVLVGLAAGGWIAQTYGWRAAFLFFGAPGIVLAALVRLVVREPQRGVFELASAQSGTQRTLRQQLAHLWSIRALRYLCLACGSAGVAAYGYGIWATTFLVRTYGMTLAQAGFAFGVASGVGAIAGAIVSGALCDRLVARDRRWQLALPMAGIALCLPAVYAFLLWPSTACWRMGALCLPHAMVFVVVFSFFASWFPALSYAAASQVVTADERSTAAALINLFLTLFGAGLGPFVIGVLSDYLVPLYGHDALRYALAATMTIFVATVAFYGAALNPYGRRLEALGASASRLT